MRSLLNSKINFFNDDHLLSFLISFIPVTYLSRLCGQSLMNVSMTTLPVFVLCTCVLPSRLMRHKSLGDLLLKSVGKAKHQQHLIISVTYHN